jgi:hypothetical protein
MKGRITYTESAKSFILECLDYDEKNGFLIKDGKFVMKNGDRIRVESIKGFSKDEVLI